MSIEQDVLNQMRQYLRQLFDWAQTDSMSAELTASLMHDAYIAGRDGTVMGSVCERDVRSIIGMLFGNTYMVCWTTGSDWRLCDRYVPPPSRPWTSSADNERTHAEYEADIDAAEIGRGSSPEAARLDALLRRFSCTEQELPKIIRGLL